MTAPAPGAIFCSSLNLFALWGRQITPIYRWANWAVFRWKLAPLNQSGGSVAKQALSQSLGKLYVIHADLHLMGWGLHKAQMRVCMEKEKKKSHSIFKYASERPRSNRVWCINLFQHILTFRWYLFCLKDTGCTFFIQTGGQKSLQKYQA